MAKALTVYDPYRNKSTSITEFAKAENVPRSVVSHYCWYHDGSLEGFRDRPVSGNGRKPSTYTRNGKAIKSTEAYRIFGGNGAALVALRKTGVSDIDELAKKYRENIAKKREKYLREADDGRLVSATEFAKEQGVSYNTVIGYLRHHGGSLKGFANRGASRVRPPLYIHTALNMQKSIGGWAQHFGVSKSTIKLWLRKHGRKIDGFENRNRFNGKPPTIVEWKGRKATLRE